MRNFDAEQINKELKGKTVEYVQVAVKSVVVKFTDGTYLDVDFDNVDQSLSTSISKE